MYMGILFSSSVTFSYCRNDLYKRELKTNFKISKCFGDLHQNVDTMLDLLDHTVKSVLAANNVLVVCKMYYINTL